MLNDHIFLSVLVSLAKNCKVCLSHGLVASTVHVQRKVTSLSYGTGHRQSE